MYRRKSLSSTVQNEKISYNFFMFSNQKFVIGIGDFITFCIAFCIMALVRFNVGAQGTSIWYQLQLFLVLFLSWLVVFFIFNLYTPQRINPNPRNIGLIIIAMTINALIGVLLFYLVPQSGISPKTNLIILILAAIVLVSIWRRVCYILFIRHFARKVLLIGTHPFLQHLCDEFQKNPTIGIVIDAYETIPTVQPKKSIDLIIAEHVDAQALLHYARQCNAQPISLFEAYEVMLGKIPVELMTEERALMYMSTYRSLAEHVAYRIFEILGASIVLICTAPFICIAACAQWIEDRGPILYSQSRVGKNGVVFLTYKLRSMRVDAEEKGARWAQIGDSRITKVGAFLRKTHLDEIPQMWNIIRGDLAAIGPRAERPEFVTTLEKEIPYYYLRHTIKPGFTGWAQIKYRYARSVTESKEKFEYDLYYLKNKSPLLDIGIILKTLQIIFTH